jgi:MFS family permease
VELGFSFRGSLASTLVLFGFYGVFYALTEGSLRALIAETVAQEARGSAYAAYYALTGVAVIAGGYGLGHIWDVVSPEVAFRLSAAGSLFACLILAGTFVKRPNRLNAGQAPASRND